MKKKNPPSGTPAVVDRIDREFISTGCCRRARFPGYLFLRAYTFQRRQTSNMMRLAVVWLLMLTASAFMTPLAPRVLLRPLRAASSEDAAARQAAQQQIDRSRSLLIDGATMPKLDALQEVVSRGGSKYEVGEAMFRLMCYITIYVRPEGEGASLKLIPDEANASLDPANPDVKQQMSQLYQQGIQYFAQGMLTEEALPLLVTEELCAPMQMDGEAFEVWLGVTE
jgi:hypothetical protein